MKKSVSFHSQLYVISMLLICRRAQNNSCAIKIKVTGNNPSLMGLDLLPILPCALPSGSVVAIVGRSAHPQQQNGRFLLLMICL
jgi:hypothetical protein